VLAQLVDVGKVEPDRLFVVEPELPAVEEEAATDPQTLVELAIK